jgi:hypothetical protein
MASWGFAELQAVGDCHAAARQREIQCESELSPAEWSGRHNAVIDHNGSGQD